MCPRPFRTMSSSIFHSCPFCGHVTDISEILADFVGNPHCTQCGLSASEGNLKAQDDLVALFNTHMNMESSPLPEKKEVQGPAPQITYSITQHYHHSAHVAQRTEPSETMQGHSPLMANELANWVFETLRQHRIDPSSLSTGQLELFANAMPEQQSRLVQMWQICPEPRKSAPGSSQLEMNCYAQGQDRSDNSHGLAEPYMLAGYDLNGQVAPLANEPTTGSPYRLSSDPIYQAGGQRRWERTCATAMEY
ncbi:hypothetical protein BJY01DRAFT_201871 [Aspergillus pseudoustus]|uniref:Uncharacterized protein n=1 Tax=Aspergillus pseudoustus TaxID=1810923 RepID=A0ABR4L0N3_9EURO